MCIWYDDTSLLGINDVYRERHMRVERKSDWDSAVEDNTLVASAQETSGNAHDILLD